MKTVNQICSFEIEKYAREYTFGGYREGYYIHLKDTSGNTATGEVAPLPGRSLESLHQAYENLERLRRQFLENDFSPFSLYPSVMFGMQMALYQLQHPNEKSNCDTTKLFLTPPTFFGAKGPVKLKLGHLDVDGAVSFFNKFKRKEKNIRLDLERLWPLDKTLEFCSKIDTSSIFYIEDPVDVFSELEIFYEKTKVPYAIDQFLSFAPPEIIKELKGLYCLIAKPSLVGGVHECQRLQEIYAPIPIAISSLFETDVGIEHVKLISSKLCPGLPCGCDTLKYIKPL